MFRPAPDLEAAAARLLAAAPLTYQGGTGFEDMQAAVRGVIKAAKRTDPQSRRRLVGLLEPGLEWPAPFESGVIVLALGAMVESGRADPAEVFEVYAPHLEERLAVAGRIQAIAAREGLPVYDVAWNGSLDAAWGRAADEDPVSVKTYRAVERSWAGCVFACLLRSREARRWITPALLANARAVGRGFVDPLRLLAMPIEEPLVVLDPATGEGWRTTMSDLTHLTQLRHLLRAVVPAEGRRLVGASSLRSDGTLLAEAEPLDGDGMPADLPLLGPDRVAILAPVGPVEAEAWRQPALFESLDPTLSPLERLDADEVSRLLIAVAGSAGP